jgi:hypothetical protein
MRHSRSHDAIEQHVETIMARANRWCLIALVAYGAPSPTFCWRLS